MRPSDTWDGARAAVFAPVARVDRVASVVTRLTEAIALGVLQDGERLPSESDLAAQFGVSTVSLREALMALRQQGLVETRRGRGGGTFVRGPDEALDTRLADRVLALSMDALRDLHDHYGAIRGTAARLAAERAGPADLRRLQDALTAFEAATEPASARRADRFFHLEVAAASQSVRLTRAEVGFQAEVGGLLWLRAGETDRRAAARDHAATLRAIARGDGPRARRRAEQHLATAITRLRHLRLLLLAERQVDGPPPGTRP